jgi:hypothetical protein
VPVDGNREIGNLESGKFLHLKSKIPKISHCTASQLRRTPHMPPFIEFIALDGAYQGDSPSHGFSVDSHPHACRRPIRYFRDFGFEMQEFSAFEISDFSDSHSPNFS